MGDDGTSSTVPDWWQPRSASPEESGLSAPVRNTKLLGRKPIIAVLRQLGAAVDERGLRRSKETYKRPDGTVVGTGVDDNEVITVYFRWSIKQTESGVELTEELFLAPWVRYLEATVPASMAVLFTALAVGDSSGGRAWLVGFLAVITIGSMIAWLVTLIIGQANRDILERLDGQIRPGGARTLSRAFLIGGASIPAILSTVAGDRALLGAAVIAVIATIVSFRYQHRIPGIPDFSVVLPAGSTEYLFLTLFSGIPVTIVTAGRRGWFPVDPITLGMLAGISGLFASVIVGLFLLRPRDTVDAFRRGGTRYVESRLVHFLMTFVSIIAATVTFLAWADTVQWVLTVIEAVHQLSVSTLLIGAFVVTAVLAPTLYLLLGLVIQAGSAVGSTVILYHTVLKAPTAPDAVAAVVPTPVVVVPDQSPEAFAVGEPFKHIVVTQGLLDQLTTAEAKAVVAHEDAHARVYSDAFLATLVPLLSSVLLIGQNALLGALDYRRREFRADQHAVEMTSPEALRGALESLTINTSFDPNRVDKHMNVSEGKSGSQPTIIGKGWFPVTPKPPLPPFSVSRFIDAQDMFAPVFTAFSLVEAHPSVEERLRSIDCLDRSQDEY